jgi:hypothetical protein
MTEDELRTRQWMFQYNPRWYDLEASIKRSLVEDWIASAYWSEYRVGQRVYFMRSAAGRPIDQRRFSAVGRIVSQAYQKHHPRTNKVRWWVDVVYDYLVVPNFACPRIMADAHPNFSTYRPSMVGQVREKFAMHGHRSPSLAIASAPMIPALMSRPDQPSAICWRSLQGQFPSTAGCCRADGARIERLLAPNWNLPPSG